MEVTRIIFFRVTHFSILELIPVKELSKGIIQLNLGPLYDKNGVIERSIVGKPEVFNRLKNQSVQGIKFSSQNVSSTAMKFVRRISSRRSTNTIASIKQSLKNQEETHRNQQETKRNKDFDIVSKAELLKMIHQISERIKQNQSDQEQEQNKLSLHEQLQHSQQHRILKKFCNQQQVWNDEISKSTQNTNRNNGESVICNAQQYRKKVEQMELQEALKHTLGEKTINQWYMSLRQNVQVAQDKQDSFKEQVFQDVNNKNSLIVDTTFKQLEIIRQPGFYFSHNNSINRQIQNESKSRLNSTHLSFYQSQLPSFKVSGVNEDAIEGLQIEGISIFKLECDQVLDAGSEIKFRLYKKKEEKQDDEMVEEVE